MDRRAYLKHTGVVCGAGSLAGCGFLFGGDSDGDDGESDGSDGDDGGSGDDGGTATPESLSTELESALSAKEKLFGTYTSAVEEFQNIDETGGYFPQEQNVDEQVTSLEDALAEVGSDEQGEKVALQGFVDYVSQAVSILADGNSAVIDLADVINGLVDSGPANVGIDGALEQASDTAGTFGNMKLSYEDLGTELNALSANSSVFPESEVSRLESSHDAVLEQIEQLQTLQEAIVAYIEGVQKHRAAASDRSDAQRAGDPDRGGGVDLETAQTKFEASITKLETSVSKLETAESKLLRAKPAAQEAFTNNLDLLECRAGAISDASSHLKTASEVTLGQITGESDLSREEAQQQVADAQQAAAEDLQRCSTSSSS